MPRSKQPIPLNLKYKLYEQSVQSFECDVDFIMNQYKKVYGVKPQVLREDFCGTGAMACEWVKRGNKNLAYGIDLDPEPMRYGEENHVKKLTTAEKKRFNFIKGNVLDSYEFKADVVAAFNFSYFIFKKRSELLSYFKKVREGISDKGAFFLDIFGGSECFEPLEEETEFDKFSYFWDLDKFNPITNECLYYIHFKSHKDKVKYERVFTYDWRMWSVVEIREILEEAGFSKSFLFWEDEDEEGDGNGEFYVSDEEENCLSWVSYILAIP